LRPILPGMIHPTSLPAFSGAAPAVRSPPVRPVRDVVPQSVQAAPLRPQPGVVPPGNTPRGSLLNLQV